MTTTIHRIPEGTVAPTPAPEPTVCPVCLGTGTVTAYSYAIGTNETRCEGPDADGTCDDGTIW